MQGKPRDTPEVVGILIQKSREIMSLSDQTLYCRDCNQEFVFTVGEQEFYASHNLTNAPTRCPSCRAARKAQSGGGYGSRGGGAREAREPRQMYTVICSNCGNEAQVPFQPRSDKPVYCSDCYQPQKSGRSDNQRSRW
jgi:CxxC-x17-CxxC domain-containing protein